MSYYLKYRPQQTKDLDIKIVRDFFAGVLKSGKFSHAYLFSGPRGTGKTSSARILAKLINCEKNSKKIDDGKPLQEPCGKCDMCKRIVAGNSLSVIEMDAASNRGIDDIRALRERIGLAPAEGKFVVYIIDEVHMLTTEAFNALLKTLEEPPAHAVFALCTTEYHKLPQTVVSRCTQVLYPKATTEEVVGSLQKSVKGEDIKISDESLQLLAESVDGSFRDGMKMLEQLAVEGDISDEAVQTLVKRSSTYDASPFISALLKKDVGGALDLLSDLEKMGVDFAVYAKRVLEVLREMLLTEMKKPTGSHADLISLTDKVSQSSLLIKDAFVPQLPLELLVAEWCMEISQNSNVKTQNENPKVNNLEVRSESQKAPVQIRHQTSLQQNSLESGGQAGQVNIKHSSISNRPEPNQARDKEAQNSNVKTQNSIQKSKIQNPTSRSTKGDMGSEVVGRKVEYVEGDVSYDQVLSKWQEILRAIKPHNHSLEALMKSARPKMVDGSSLVIEVFYKFHKERLEQDKHRAIIEDVISEIFKSKVRLAFELGEKTATPVVDVSASGSSVAPKPTSSGDGELAAAAEEIFG